MTRIGIGFWNHSDIGAQAMRPKEGGEREAQWTSRTRTPCSIPARISGKWGHEALLQGVIGEVADAHREDDGNRAALPGALSEVLVLGDQRGSRVQGVAPSGRVLGFTGNARSANLSDGSFVLPFQDALGRTEPQFACPPTLMPFINSTD